MECLTLLLLPIIFSNVLILSVHRIVGVGELPISPLPMIPFVSHRSHGHMGSPLSIGEHALGLQMKGFHVDTEHLQLRPMPFDSLN